MALPPTRPGSGRLPRNVLALSAVSLLIVDESSRVPDELYLAVRPMLAAAENPRLWLISTPNGRSGFFYETWTSPDPAWTRLRASSTALLASSA